MFQVHHLVNPQSLTNPRSGIQAARQELARQRATDDLKNKLEKRPDRDELIER